MTHPYQIDETTDTLVVQHRLAYAAEDTRTTLLVADNDHFVGKITAAGEDTYRVTNAGGDTREFSLADIYTVRLVNQHYARVELFPGKQAVKGKVE